MAESSHRIQPQGANGSEMVDQIAGHPWIKSTQLK